LSIFPIGKLSLPYAKNLKPCEIINKKSLTFLAISRIQKNNYGSLQQNKVKRHGAYIYGNTENPATK